MSREENHDSRLYLSSSSPLQPERQPLSVSVSVPVQEHQQSHQGMVFPVSALSPPQPVTQPPVSLPIQELPRPHQGMWEFFSVSQYPEAPPELFHIPQVPIPTHQPSSSSQVPVPQRSLQDDQYQAAMMWPLNQNTMTPQYIPPSSAPGHVQITELIPLTSLDKDQEESGSSRKSTHPRLMEGKSLNIAPPYPWATSRRAHVYSLDKLLSNGINLVRGQVRCNRCKNVFYMEFDSQNKFLKVAEFIRQNKSEMQGKAPRVWMKPVFPSCKGCRRENCAKPVILKKREINWLFLFLGQWLGCCKNKHLRYFFKHTSAHGNYYATKDRLLFVTYMGLCKQLDPGGHFGV